MDKNLNNKMILEKDICFVTTTLYTKFLAYQSTILRKEFPDSQHLIINVPFTTSNVSKVIASLAHTH